MRNKRDPIENREGTIKAEAPSAIKSMQIVAHLEQVQK